MVFGLLMKLRVGSENGQGSDGSTRVYIADDEDMCRLMMDYTPKCRCGVQVDR
jgi:hypothetical protein